MFDYVHPGDHVEMAEQLGMKLPPGRGMSLSQGAVNEDGASSASSSSHSETPEPGGKGGTPGCERTIGEEERREWMDFLFVFGQGRKRWEEIRG